MRRDNRLNSPAAFRRLFKKGRRLEGRFLRVVYLLSDAPHPHFAFIVPLAVDKRSTARNRLKRRAREWVRRHIDLLKRPLDVAIIFKKEAKVISQKEFYEDLARIFKQIVG